MTKHKGEVRNLFNRVNHAYVFSLSMVLVLTVGCASSVMTLSREDKSPIPSNESRVTFLRPTNYGWAVIPGIWDSTKLIGTQATESCIQYVTSPGEHLFLAKNDNWNYLKAKLDPGKQYYVHTRIWAGFASKGVILDPVKNEDNGEVTWEDISKWTKNCKSLVLDENRAKDYIETNIADVMNAIEAFRRGSAKSNMLDGNDGR